jgi:hypothetical protein
MIRQHKISGNRIGARLCSALCLRRSMVRDDRGQALLLVLIAIMLFTLLVPIVVSDVISEDTNSAHGVNFEASLAAAEAGVQQYRNFLDVDSNYWKYTSSNNLYSDPALAAGGWQQIANTIPTEWFHYLPNTSFLPTGSGSVSPAVLLTVTGRAGAPGNYSYRTIQVTFQTTGLLTDAYFSQYETLDPSQDTAAAAVTTGGATSTVTPYAVSLPGAVPDTGGTTNNLWVALCQYDNWQPNAFIDNLGTAVASGGSGGTAMANPYKGGSYSTTYPYYGPWRGNEPNKSANNNTFIYTAGSGSTAWSVNVQDPCGPVYNFVAGETFNGPVYSDDQLWICNPGGGGGSGPTFSDGIAVGDMPAGGFPYAYTQWPAQPSAASPGWVDDGPLNWDASCGGYGAGTSSGENLGAAPNPHSAPQVSPQNVDTALLTQAGLGGCVYTGPTMIEFVAGGTYNVWSPDSATAISGIATGYGPSVGMCGTFSTTTAAGAFQTGLTIPPAGLLMYVNNLASSVTPPSLAQYVTAGALPAGATCLNPWKPYSPASSQINSQTCGVVSREGDVVVEGEVQGQVTLAAEDNIVVSRDITYECADTSGADDVAQQQSSSYVLPSGCYTESPPDVLGLVADGDVVIGHPAVCNTAVTPGCPDIPGSAPATADNALQTGMPGTCATEASGAGCSPTTPPVGTYVGYDDNTPVQTEPYEWPAVNPAGSATEYCGQQGVLNSGGGVDPQDGMEANQTLADVVPDCDLQNPVIDAATVALGGSLADEDWDAGANDAGGAYVQGADISWARGPFGYSGTTGYAKHFTYDTRLQYLTPPNMDLVAGLSWNAANWVACGTVNDSSVTNANAAGVCPALLNISG